MGLAHVVHTFAPVYNRDSEILILGSFPSVKSRENSFYYGHPRNRFWNVVTQVCNELEGREKGLQKTPRTIEEKKCFLLKNHIALWDVIASCDIQGSSDSSIQNVVANDIDGILKEADIRAIFCNGDKAYQLFLKYCKKEGQPPVYKLPSTSPANAAWDDKRLAGAWTEAIGGLAGNNS